MSRKRVSVGEALFKVIMVGDSGTGKSCLLSRYVKDYFTPEYHVTLGAEFESKVIQIDDNYKVRLQIWDTAGQETFRSIVKSFYRNSAAILLVYNITKGKSFQNLTIWHRQARQNSPAQSLFILIGTHLDLEDKREVTSQQVREFVREHSIAMSFETSAKENINIAHTFEQIAKQVFVGYLSKRRFSEIANPKAALTAKMSADSSQKKQCC